MVRTRVCTIRRVTRRGLTLLELLVALAIASLVMLMAGGALRTTVGLVGDARVDEQRGSRESRVLTLFTAQISWVRVAEDGGATRFRGGPEALEMETLVSMRRPERREPVAARYRVEREGDQARVVYDEEPGKQGGAREQGRVLVSGLAEAQFEYLIYEAGAGASWRSDWDSSTLPRAVRLTMTDRKGETTRWVVPVMATF